MKGFAHLYQLINNPEEIVRINTVSVFTILARNFPNVFLNNNKIAKIFQHLIKVSEVLRAEDIIIIV